MQRHHHGVQPFVLSPMFSLARRFHQPFFHSFDPGQDSCLPPSDVPAPFVPSKPLACRRSSCFPLSTSSFPPPLPVLIPFPSPLSPPFSAPLFSPPPPPSVSYQECITVPSTNSSSLNLRSHLPLFVTIHEGALISLCVSDGGGR